MFLIFIQEKSLYKNCFPLLGTESSKLCFTEFHRQGIIIVMCSLIKLNNEYLSGIRPTARSSISLK